MQKIEALRLLTKIFLEQLYSSEMKMQQGAGERRVYKRAAHTQATSNDAASALPMSIVASAVKSRDDIAIRPPDNNRVSCVVILSDELIFQKCIEDVLTLKTQKKPKIFEGNQALSQYNQYVRQSNLFESPSDAIIVLDENFTAKKLDAEQKFLFQSRVFIFGKAGLRHYVDEKVFPDAVFYLCYAPNDYERQKCAEFLAQKYIYKREAHTQPTSNDAATSFPMSISQHALMLYNNDLYHCVLHFERMQKSGLSFNDAILSDSPVSEFDIIQTLLDGDLSLLDMRLYQYSTNKGEAAHILRALMYFFKQLVFVHAELVKNTDLTNAFFKAKIPYPAQNNIKKAIQIIPYTKIEHFFSIAAQLEIDLRERKNAHQFLFLELSQLISVKGF